MIIANLFTSHNINLGVSETQRYTQCGNAVTTKIIKSIMEQLIGGKFTQGATPSFNMGLTASAMPSPKCPSDTSPSPNIMSNLNFHSQALQ